MATTKSRTIRAAGIVTCLLQFLFNFLTSLGLLTRFGNYASTLLAYGAFFMCACTVLACFGAVHCSILFGCTLFVQQLCMLNQVAYKECNDFLKNECAIWNTCSEDIMRDCKAPSQEVCEVVEKLSTWMVAITFMSIAVNVVPGSIAFVYYHKLELEREHTFLSAQTIVPQVSPKLEEDIPSKLQERLEHLEKNLAEANLVLSHHKELLRLALANSGNNDATDKKVKSKKKRSKSREKSATTNEGKDSESKSPETLNRAVSPTPTVESNRSKHRRATITEDDI